MADEVAFATTWLCRNGVEAASMVATHLDQISNIGVDALKLSSLTFPWRGTEKGLCSVSAGAVFSDLATEPDVQSTELIDVVSPMLLIPFVAYASQRLVKHHNSLTIEDANSNKLACLSSVNCDSFSANIAAVENHAWLHGLTRHNASDTKSELISDKKLSAGITHCTMKTCAIEALNDNPKPARHRLDIPSDTLDKLNHYASLTYAPATEASREGAGAGTTDND